LLPRRNTAAENREHYRDAPLKNAACDAVEHWENIGGRVMRHIATALLATTAFFVGLAQSASAADMRVPYRPPAPPPPAYFSWTGCYIGGHLGGGWGEKTVSVPTLAPGVSVTGDTSGFLGGGQVGCNFQFGSNWVIGIEGDGSGSDIRGDITQTVLGITGTAHAQTDWIASATGRLGWAWDRWLLYAKGGAAWAGDKYSAFIPVFNEQLEASETRAGWTVGGGIEWALWSNWSAKAEYDYYDFGTRTLTLTGTFAGVPIQVPGVNVRQRISVGKFGINYRF
jgi:outer membrane immunogenic protein